MHKDPIALTEVCYQQVVSARIDLLSQCRRHDDVLKRDSGLFLASPFLTYEQSLFHLRLNIDSHMFKQ